MLIRTKPHQDCLALIIPHKSAAFAAHAAGYAVHAAAYAVEVVAFAAGPTGADAAARERDWQCQHLLDLGAKP
jgi:hypothetical protein